MLDNDIIVVECCSTNIFWCLGSKVFTPSLSYAGVAGMMRRRVMPTLGYKIEEVSFITDFLKTVDEVFITSVLLPLVSVSTISTIGNR